MKHFLLSVFTFCLLPIAYCQIPYWQQQVNYIIDVSLNDSTHTLNGFEKITYVNNSPDTLTYIWFHVWPNAYKNDRTAFSDQMLVNGNTKFYFSSKEQRGYINRMDFKIDGVGTKTEDHPHYIDVIKVLLPSPLPPSGQITITTPFHVKLPYNFSRGGHDGHSYQVTQWYPKPAVYDARGWHPMPYLDQGEYYSEFGSFNVRITLPQDYVVAATGVLQNAEEKEWLKKKGIRDWESGIRKKEQELKAKGKEIGKKAPPPVKKTNEKESKAKEPVNKKGKQPVKTVPPVREPKTINHKPQTLKTLQYLQDSIHDFAWFADKNFIVDQDTCSLPSGRVIDVCTYYTPSQRKNWKNSVQFGKDAVRFYSAEVGEYPYRVLSAVQGPKSFGGGMEYPTITVIAPLPTEKALDVVMAHEIGHNWFYGILGSNEREHPWMDEGVNSFYEYKYSAQKYGSRPGLQQVLLETKTTEKTDQPIELPADSFSRINYALVVYHKTAEWLQLMEQKMGSEAFRKSMHDYFTKWKFKHPQPDDFKNTFQPALPAQEAGNLFHLLTTKGALPAVPKRGWKVASPLVASTLKAYSQNTSQNVLLISPALGYNQYDKLMVGGAITNYKLPPTRLQFLAVPLYGIHSKKFNGLGRISYSVYPDRRFKQIEVAVSGMNFSKKESLDTNRKQAFESFYRITPSVRITFNQPALSSRERSLEAKTFFIGEHYFSNRVQKSGDELTLYIDTIKYYNRFINQLTFSENNTRALYPYQYQLQLQQGKAFYRINLLAHYFFNYANGGGLKVRLFAAKFGQIGNSKTDRFSNFIYQPKLLGVTGEEDYTYGNYFLGRTASFANSDNDPVKNKGTAARQIMIRDGGLKIRADQYEFLQGRSDNWVAAINFNTTLPKGLFPIPLPLKLFLDAGTYSEAWQKSTTGSRFLYVSGLQLYLFKDLINVYLPVVYSRVFRENVNTLPEQNSFFKRMTFSIDIQNINHRHPVDNKLFY